MRPAPPGINPKAWKLDYALPLVRAPISLILDNDAQLTNNALAQVLQDLTHADVVTALPYYQDSATLAGRLLWQFVNNNGACNYSPRCSFRTHYVRVWRCSPTARCAPRPRRSGSCAQCKDSATGFRARCSVRRSI